MTVTANHEDGTWVSARIEATGFRTQIRARAHSLVADEPSTVGGTDAGPTPYELLLGALASCTAMTARMYASRKDWPLERVTVQLRSARSHEKDCERCEAESVGIGRVERRVAFDGPLSDNQRRRLLEIADRCPVKQTLERGLQIVNVE